MDPPGLLVVAHRDGVTAFPGEGEGAPAWSAPGLGGGVVEVGGRVVAGSPRGDLVVLEGATGAERARFAIHDAGAVPLGLAGPEVVVSRGDDGWIHEVALAGGAILRSHFLPTGRAAGVAFAPGGRRLVHGGRDLAVHDLRERRVVLRYREARDGEVRDLALVPGREEAVVAVAARAGEEVRRVDLTRGATRWRVPVATPTARVLAGAGRVLVADTAGELRVLDLDTGATLGTYPLPLETAFGIPTRHAEALATAALSPDGERLVYGWSELREVDAVAGRPRETWAPRGSVLAPWNSSRAVAVRALAFTPAGNLLGLVAPSRGDTLELWDLDAREQLAELLVPERDPGEGARADPPSIAALHPGPGPVRVAAAATDRRLELLTLGAEARRGSRELEGALLWRGAAELAFSPEGEALAASWLGGALHVLDPEDGSDVAVLAAARGEVMAAAVSPRQDAVAAVGRRPGLWLLGLGREGDVRRVDLGEEGRQLPRVAFDPAGTEVAAAGTGGSEERMELRIDRVEVATGEVVASLRTAGELRGLGYDDEALRLPTREGPWGLSAADPAMRPLVAAGREGVVQWVPLAGGRWVATGPWNDLHVIGPDGVVERAPDPSPAVHHIATLAPGDSGLVVAQPALLRVAVVDVRTGEVGPTLEPAELRSPPATDGRGLVALAGDDGAIDLWRPAAAALEARGTVPLRLPGRMAFSATGSRLAICGYDEEDRPAVVVVGVPDLAVQEVIPATGGLTTRLAWRGEDALEAFSAAGGGLLAQRLLPRASWQERLRAIPEDRTISLPGTRGGSMLGLLEGTPFVAMGPPSWDLGEEAWVDLVHVGEDSSRRVLLPAPPTAIASLPGGDRALVGGTGGLLAMLDLARGEVVATWSSAYGRATALEVLAEAGLVAVLAADGSVGLYPLEAFL